METRGMSFSEALAKMQEGENVKLPNEEDYLCIEKGNIKLKSCCKASDKDRDVNYLRCDSILSNEWCIYKG